MIRKIRFIDMPELKITMDNPKLIDNLRCIQLRGDELAQVNIFVLPVADRILIKFDDRTCLSFSNNLNDEKIYQGSYNTYYIFSAKLKEFVNEQLLSNNDTLFIPKLVGDC